MTEALETTEKATSTENQTNNNAGAGSEEAGKTGVTEKQAGATPAEEYLKNVLNTGGSKLDDISAVTAKRHDGTEGTQKQAETKTETKEKETKTETQSQETKTKGDGLILKLNTAEGDTDIDLNNPDQLQQLIDTVQDGKLQIEIGNETKEFDLTSEDGIQKLKAAVKVSGEVEQTGTQGDLVELKAGEDIEKFDWKKEEDRKKLVQYANKGRFFEKERAAQLKQFSADKETIDAEKQQVSTFGEAVGHAILFNISQGKFNQELLMEKPYEHFLDKVEDDPASANLSYQEKQTEATKLWNEHNNSVAKTKAEVADFKANYQKTAQGFQKMITDFQTKHKEEFKDLKAVMEWFNDNVGPFSAPILTYGKAQYPEDLLDMVYFWKNKDKLLAHAKEEGAKKYAKAKIIKRDSTSSLTNQHPADKAVTYLKRTLHTEGRKIAH